MHDAFGGILNIFLVVIFLVIVEALLGLVVCYTKAFKMKNYTISTIEQYEASNCFTTGSSTSACRKKISENAENIGYSPTSLSCPTGFVPVDNLFCYGKTDVLDGKVSYTIITQVDINFPLFDQLMGFHFFQVSGDTRYIEIPKGK